TLAQSHALAKVLEETGRTVTAALLLEAPDHVVIDRLAGRRHCAAGHVYHVAFHPPIADGICDHDGRPLIKRDDDDPVVIERRLNVFHANTGPVIDFYRDAGLLHRLDASLP